MVDKKFLSIASLLSFIALTIYLSFNSDKIGSIISGNGFVGLGWYILSDFKNWVIIVGAVIMAGTTSLGRRIGAGLAVAFAADIISYPRLLSTAAPVQGEAMRASLDWMVVNVLPFSYGINWKIYYLVVPVVLMVAAFNLLGYKTFLSHVTGK